MTEPLATRDPGRIVFVVVFIAGMILATFWVVQPFLPAAIWAATIVVATWPLLLRLQRVLWGRRSLAVAVMTTLLLLCLIVPLVVGLGSILAHADDIAGWLRSLATWFPPPAPDWLARVPVVGPRLAARWTELAAAGSGEVSARLTPYGGQIVGWIAETIGDLGLLLVHFILVVIFAAILYGSGETAAQATRRLAWRLAAARGEHSARLAVGAVRGVALGIVVAIACVVFSRRRFPRGGGRMSN